jgi:hypothetical protein
MIRCNCEVPFVDFTEQRYWNATCFDPNREFIDGFSDENMFVRATFA